MTLKVDVELETPAGRLHAVATTLGAGGLFVATDSPLTPGTALIVRFQLPGEEREQRFRARIVWRAPVGSGAGVEFCDSDARARFARVLEHWAAKRGLGSGSGEV